MIEQAQTDIYQIRPVGYARTTTRIEILPEYEPLLDGIDGFSHIVVVFWPHKLPEDERKIQKVHPRGIEEIPRQGIFATRSPARPNPILISTVQLINRQQTCLEISALDCMDNTPILDIKPITRLEVPEEALRFPDWVRQVHARPR